MYGRDINRKKLNDNPVVETIYGETVGFTLPFRIKLFEKWKENPTPETIEEELKKVDILAIDLLSHSFKDICARFKYGGYPLPTEKSHPEIDPEYKETNPLILSGKFYRKKRGFGMTIDPGFRQELMEAYPDTSIEDMLRRNGIDPLDVGCERIGRLEQAFKREIFRRYAASEGVSKVEDHVYAASPKLLENPYVEKIVRGNLYMKNAFFNEVYMIPIPLSKIFEIYGIDDSLVNTWSKTRINSSLQAWKPLETEVIPCNEGILKIQNRRASMMFQEVRKGFCELGQIFKTDNYDIQRKVCRWADGLPSDPWGYYSRKRILKLMDLSKSRYYALLHNETYGTGKINRCRRDEEDIAIIRQVLAYKGFEKGIRQVYMLMPRVTGQSFSMYKIRRLMNKYGIRTTIRRPSRNRKAMKELIARNQKANLIMRRFRLHRPNEIRLTDVTYLDYGDGLRAYGSASVDPVTGRLICFIVSENNDLQLALDTLAAMDSYPAKSGAILHSDQGMLYMSDDFQAAVVERELTQSMSRRGNCWDNAVQESFFGHFKDECPYEACKSLDELQECIDRYGFYYNNERGMWDREKMTPAEYEQYLEQMSEAEFAKYLAREEERFEKMKVKSAKNAHMAARSYKEFTEKSIGGLNDETGGSFKKV